MSSLLASLTEAVSNAHLTKCTEEEDVYLTDQFIQALDRWMCYDLGGSRAFQECAKMFHEHVVKLNLGAEGRADHRSNAVPEHDADQESFSLEDHGSPELMASALLDEGEIGFREIVQRELLRWAQFWWVRLMGSLVVGLVAMAWWILTS
ncbi:hypothetical protein BC629DRAFT_447088 [Irpex lacteus]|nr:hypothetical protein BC629DRAFT_447088 [Irpex lacteus]